jgi:hypothetical protein
MRISPTRRGPEVCFRVILTSFEPPQGRWVANRERTIEIEVSWSAGGSTKTAEERHQAK